MHRKHYTKQQPKPSEKRTAHKFKDRAPNKVKNIRVVNSTNAMLERLTQVNAIAAIAAINTAPQHIPTQDVFALVSSLNSYLHSNNVSRQTRGQMQLSIMLLLVVATTIASATKIIPEANNCDAGKKLGTLDYLGTGKQILIADGCTASDIRGTFDESCRTVSVIDEYKQWGSYNHLIEVCNFAIHCISLATGELQRYNFETTWRSPNGYNMSYASNTLTESWKKSNGFYGYDGFYTKDVPRQASNICEIPSDAEYFKLTQ